MRNRDYFEGTYKYFRGLFEELSKLNTDYSKDTGIKKEADVVRKWLTAQFGEEALEKEKIKNFYFDLLDSEWLSQGDSELRYSGKDIRSDLENYKRENTRAGVVWILTGSGAKLEGSTIDKSGKPERNLLNNFMKLLDTLQFSDEARVIFKEKDTYRFNAVNDPAGFLEEIYNERHVFSLNIPKVIKEYCKDDSWQEKCGDMESLIDLWIKNKKNSEVKEEIDFVKYHKTVRLFSNLIPLVSEDGTLKSIEEYNKEKKSIESVVYDYYKKKILDQSGGYLQGLDKGGGFVKKLEEVIDLIDKGSVNGTQRDFLMSQYLVCLDKTSVLTRLYLAK